MSFLTPEQISAIHRIETHWQLYRKFKSPDGFNLAEALINPNFQKALNNRGIIVPDSRENEVLTQEQLAAITLAANFSDKRTLRSKLKSLGITMTKWNGWLRDKEFVEALHSLTGSQFENSLHLAQAGLINGIERGDVSAIKYYMEITGRYREDDLNAQNVKLMITRVIEAIQYRVKDQETIKALASDFQLIFDGKAPEYSVKELK